MQTWMSKRYSCRNYNQTPLPTTLLEEIKTYAQDFYFPHHLTLDWHINVLEDGSLIHEAFKGLLSRYAKVVAPHYLVLSCEKHRNSGFLLGFLGEYYVKLLTEKNIGTCWIGFPLKGDCVEKIGLPKAHSQYILIAFGEPNDASPIKKTRKMKSLEKIGFNSNDESRWLYESLQCAPSAMNTQPWHLFYENGQYHYDLDPKHVLYWVLREKHAIDLGIGFFHLYDAIKDNGYRMRWDFLQDSEEQNKTVLTFKYFV